MILELIEYTYNFMGPLINQLLPCKQRPIDSIYCYTAYDMVIIFALGFIVLLVFIALVQHSIRLGRK